MITLNLKPQVTTPMIVTDTAVSVPVFLSGKGDGCNVPGYLKAAAPT